VALPEVDASSRLAEGTERILRRPGRGRAAVARCAGAVLLAAAVVLPACRRPETSGGVSDELIVFVSLLPQKYLVQRLGDDRVQIEVLVPPGREPHTFEPTPRQMTRLAGARAFFLAGVPFEETLLAKLGSARRLRIVDTTEGIERIPSTDADEPGLDPHTWMSPRLARVQAGTICEALVELDPAHAADYERNLRQLDADLDALDARIAGALAPLKGRTFFTFHPAFGYLARDYGLEQEAVEIGGKTPGPRHVKELIERARNEGVRVVFVEPQFSQRAATAIAQQIGGAVVSIDPLSEDYIVNLEEVARQIHDALAPPTAAAATR
jgi:zinc transport system substrate-binding protein